MLQITEIKKGKLSKYRIDEMIDDTILNTKTVEYPITFIDDKWLLYNDKMEIIEDVYDYLNHKRKHYSKNTYRTIAYDLRLFYIYAEIFDIDIKDFKYKDLIRLSDFLSMRTSKSDGYIFNLLTTRSRKTLLTKLSNYKNFLYYSGYSIKAFETYNASDIVSPTALSSNASYSINANILTPRYQEVPKYISLNDFKRIIAYIRNANETEDIKLRDECMVRLMFEAGLRLGETLGLTLEDVVLSTDSKNRQFGTIYIRNRTSDKSYQRAKSCMNVNATSNYRRHEYSVLGIGYQTSFISLSTYDLLMEYVDLIHGKANLKKNRKRYKKALADAVDTYAKRNEDNYYLILNRYFGPLSNVSWNAHLRKIFEDLNLDVDIGVRENNLSHRFRHGFAMYLLYDCGYPLEFVQKRMRHRNMASTEVYINPTSEKILEMKEELENDYLYTGGLIDE